MGLTVTEKTHWKDRIAARIAKRKAQLIAENDPTFMAKVQAQARQKLLADSDMTEKYNVLVELESAATQAKRVYKEAMTKFRKQFLGEDAESFLLLEWGASDLSNLEKAIVEQAKGLIEKIMATSDLGRQILALENESDNILDTVWLATSPQQIKDLWADVAELLGEAPPTLQQKIIQEKP